MIFNQGDEVVCIQNVGYTEILTINKSYKVLLSYYGSVTETEHIRVQKDDKNGHVDIFSSRFISIKEFKKIKRKEKLNILNLI